MDLAEYHRSQRVEHRYRVHRRGVVVLKKSFRWNKSGGRQLIEMHGIRSVKGKAEAAAQQFRLECVYADASHTRTPISLRLGYNSRSYYFSSVLVLFRLHVYYVDTGKRRKEKEGARKRTREREIERVKQADIGRERNSDRKGGKTNVAGRKEEGGGPWSRSCFISGRVRRSRGGKKGVKG